MRKIKDFFLTIKRKRRLKKEAEITLSLFKDIERDNDSTEYMDNRFIVIN